MSTLLDLTTRVRRRFERNLDPEFVNELVNEALQEASKRYDWPWLLVDRAAITVESDGTTFLVPGVVRSVYVDGQELRQEQAATGEAARKLRTRTWALGAAEGAQRRSTGEIAISVFPELGAGNVVTVSYKLEEPTLVADGDSPLCPDFFAYGPVVSYAVAQGKLSHRKEANEHAFWMRRYEDQILRASVDQRPVRGPVLPRTRSGARISGY